ncbi:hypothetical protein DSO57_1004425 [Entomophthora muscae]|uniref:Uncharacterized protein n=1 Tax=Entomophthora muscae TaxID=34485 RepID=A0ACC2TJ07_9FUNG|nr:hypothetical protein DSO57_1004425 [Entomophthora muscae]
MASPVTISDSMTPVGSPLAKSEAKASTTDFPFLEPYCVRSREIMQLVDQLRDEGAAQDIDLPALVFCGNQSSGKSSLVEAISGICLPRSEGTCTRCVMEVRMSASPGPWSCSISLQYKYDASGKPLSKAETLPFKDNIISGAEVEHAVRQAQWAILNPDVQVENFQSLTLDVTSTKRAAQDELEFTPNTILIKIKGSGLSLTLIDLPGMVCTTESRNDRQVVALVNDMVKRHISNPQALIIATISCKDDVENQGILGLAQEVDPSGARTIGVLTKPDTIETSCHDIWIQLLSNNRFSLNLGYYIVKSPDKQGLIENISFASARLEEKDFFSQVEPWSSSSLALKSRMGVDHLRQALSELLIELIDSSLPSMKTKVHSLLEDARVQLLKLPISKSPKLDILLAIKAFESRLNAVFSATSHNKSFYQTVNNHFSELIKALSTSRPILILPESDRPKDTAMVSEVDQYLHFGSAILPSEFTVEQISKLNQQQQGWEFANLMKHRTLQDIIKLCQGSWEQHAMTCLKGVISDLKECFKIEIKQSFGNWPNLARKVTVVKDDMFIKEVDQISLRVFELVRIETSLPTTWDSHRFDDLVSFIHLQLERAFAATYEATTKQPTRQRSLYGLFEFGDSGGKSGFKRSHSFSFPDENAIKLIEMAQAYYAIAKSRFADNISMTINYYLIQKLSTGIEYHLLTCLGFIESKFTDEECLELLEETPSAIELRKNLGTRISRLEEINGMLYKNSK